jgi:hypothetical protein
MNKITSPSVWETLSVPMPAEFIHHANLNRQIETLEKKNNTGMYIIAGLTILVTFATAYWAIEKNRREMLERMKK